MPSLLENVTVTDAFEAAHYQGTALYNIAGNVPPSYFDYHSGGTTNSTIDTYYSNMINTSLDESVKLENAENLLIYLTMHKEVTYISYMPSEILEKASQTNAYSDFIEYTFINYYDSGVGGTSPEIVDAAESGFFETQDVILCVGAMPS
ncbi:hypothetical protein [uncultured Methanolobus sp.]|uniref:hypothetical protein n=1 Tax=uncultured Methanolobus sp. TaxID=218300 RepID=UPI002AAB58EC|nr:hypothetical protein [uncultured Methanolobus sp.]